MKSIVQQRGTVHFPQHTGERIYMREFHKADGLPFDLARWQPTVDAMLYGIDTDGPIYLMVDQGLVLSGSTHRRPGVHLDGYWNPGNSSHGGHISISAHGGSGHGSCSERPAGGHGGERSNGHMGTPPNNSDSHGGGSSRHSAGFSSWAHATFAEPEAIILASSVQGCRALVGDFNGPVKDGGDCGHIELSSLREIIMAPHTVYAGNVSMLHESLPLMADALRTVVRLNVPGWSPV